MLFNCSLGSRAIAILISNYLELLCIRDILRIPKIIIVRIGRDFILTVELPSDPSISFYFSKPDNYLFLLTFLLINHFFVD